MNEKRFVYVIDNGKDTIYDLNEKGVVLENFMEIQDMLNLLNDESIMLREQLNYIQNSIIEHINHQKTNLGQKALKEIIEDYNNWLLKP